MSKSGIISIIFSCILVLTVSKVSAQTHNAKESSASAMTSVDIVLPLAAREVSQLSFGRFYPGQTGGSITVLPNGSVVTTSGVIIAASVPSAGVFTIAGQGDATFAINLPNGPAILTSADGTRTMQVNNWVSDPPNGDARVRLEGGSQTVSIGATLQVGSLDQNPRGIYTGSYEVTFGYN